MKATKLVCVLFVLTLLFTACSTEQLAQEDAEEAFVAPALSFLETQWTAGMPQDTALLILYFGAARPEEQLLASFSHLEEFTDDEGGGHYLVISRERNVALSLWTTRYNGAKGALDPVDEAFSTDLGPGDALLVDINDSGVDQALLAVASFSGGSCSTPLLPGANGYYGLSPWYSNRVFTAHVTEDWDRYQPNRRVFLQPYVPPEEVPQESRDLISFISNGDLYRMELDRYLFGIRTYYDSEERADYLQFTLFDAEGPTRSMAVPADDRILAYLRGDGGEGAWGEGDTVVVMDEDSTAEEGYLRFCVGNRISAYLVDFTFERVALVYTYGEEDLQGELSADSGGEYSLYCGLPSKLGYWVDVVMRDNQDGALYYLDCIPSRAAVIGGNQRALLNMGVGLREVNLFTGEPVAEGFGRDYSGEDQGITGLAYDPQKDWYLVAWRSLGTEQDNLICLDLYDSGGALLRTVDTGIHDPAAGHTQPLRHEIALDGEGRATLRIATGVELYEEQSVYYW